MKEGFKVFVCEEEVCRACAAGVCNKAERCYKCGQAIDRDKAEAFRRMFPDLIKVCLKCNAKLP